MCGGVPLDSDLWRTCPSAWAVGSTSPLLGFTSRLLNFAEDLGASSSRFEALPGFRVPGFNGVEAFKNLWFFLDWTFGVLDLLEFVEQYRAVVFVLGTSFDGLLVNQELCSVIRGKGG